MAVEFWDLLGRICLEHGFLDSLRAPIQNLPAEGELVAPQEFHTLVNGARIPAGNGAQNGGLGYRLSRVEMGEAFHLIRQLRLDVRFQRLGAAWAAAKGRTKPSGELRALFGLLCIDHEVRDNLKQSYDEAELNNKIGAMNFHMDQVDLAPLLGLLRDSAAQDDMQAVEDGWDVPCFMGFVRRAEHVHPVRCAVWRPSVALAVTA